MYVLKQAGGGHTFPLAYFSCRRFVHFLTCLACATLRTPWSNCYRAATASELIWLRRNVTGGRFSNLYQRVYFAYTNLAITAAVLSCSLADSDVVDHGAD